MSDQLSIEKNNDLYCTYHPEKPSILFDMSEKGFSVISDRLVCTSCLRQGRIKSDDSNLKRFKTTTTDTKSCFVLSNIEDFKEKQEKSTSQKDVRQVDYKNARIEHIIINNDTQGYPPRSLLYIEDMNILVAGSESGETILWSMDGTPTPIYKMNLHSSIRCSLYIKLGSVKYLVLGVNKKVMIYLILDLGCVEAAVLRCNSIVNDLTYNEKMKQLLVCNWEAEISVYQAPKFNLIATINTSKFNVYAPLASIFSVSEREIALESKPGISVINLEKKTAEHFRLPKRQGYGSAYLREKDQFLLRTVDGNTLVIDRESMEKVDEYKGRIETGEFPAYRYIPHRKDQILTNSGGESLLIYEKGDIYGINLQGYLNLSSGIELMSKIGKVAVADEKLGIILILSTRHNLTNLVAKKISDGAISRPSSTFKQTLNNNNRFLMTTTPTDKERSRSKSPKAEASESSVFKIIKKIKEESSDEEILEKENKNFQKKKIIKTKKIHSRKNISEEESENGSEKSNETNERKESSDELNSDSKESQSWSIQDDELQPRKSQRNSQRPSGRFIYDEDKNLIYELDSDNELKYKPTKPIKKEDLPIFCVPGKVSQFKHGDIVYRDAKGTYIKRDFKICLKRKFISDEEVNSLNFFDLQDMISISSTEAQPGKQIHMQELFHQQKAYLNSGKKVILTKDDQYFAS